MMSLVPGGLPGVGSPRRFQDCDEAQDAGDEEDDQERSGLIDAVEEKGS